MELFDSIERVLSKAAEEHMSELDKIYLEQFVFDYQPYQELDSGALKKSEKCLKELNDCINDINCKVKGKKNDIYTPLKETTCTINKKHREFIDSLVKL